MSVLKSQASNDPFQIPTLQTPFKAQSFKTHFKGQPHTVYFQALGRATLICQGQKLPYIFTSSQLTIRPAETSEKETETQG